MSVKWNRRELEALEHLDELPEVVDELQNTGEAIAERARALCPVRTGGLAESIHAELNRDRDAGLQVRVSWEKDHFYGWFVEAGTEHSQAQPFLRPAAAPYLDRPST